ncbi:pre-mycofactocin synthase MftD [Microbacterium sp. NPDC058389]|uniref:pre-mycofactocin synthase MftD n=1 Tax=Microbacterium sp. NPDC058389 TaxID=3346475 RepID=UPI00364A18BC
MTSRFATVAEAERLAQRRLPRAVWLAIKAGNERGRTLAENVEAFDHLGFSPTIFDRPTRSEIDTRTKVLGVELDIPVILSPVGAQAIHPAGEVAAARAASRAGTGIGLSSFATDSIRDVAAVNDKAFLQIYWIGTREQIAARVEAARASGARGLIVTLDWSFTQKRQDWGGPPSPPYRLDLPTMVKLAPVALSRPTWFASYLRRGKLPGLRTPNLFYADELAPTFGAVWQQFEETPTPTWDDIKWLRELWGGPFMVKGIATIHDAKRAVDLGASAISVSNHGGNNVDGTPAPIRFLPSVVDAVGDQVDVVLDGGVRRGSDVVKAVALGARAVLIGRAFLYGLASGGESGVESVLQIMRDGIEETLFGIGRRSISELTPADLVVRDPHFFVHPTS